MPAAGPGYPHPCTGAPIIPLLSALSWQCFTIEKLGRRPLIITGFCAMGTCLAGITGCLLLQVGLGHYHPVGLGCLNLVPTPGNP